MRIIETQRNFVTQLPKGTMELNNSPIGIIDCPPDEFLSKISDFKRNATMVDYSYDEFILNSGEKVIRSDYETKNGFQIFWEKFFNTDKKLTKENFIDIFDKTTIEYSPSTGEIKLLEATTPRGTVKYIFG